MEKCKKLIRVAIAVMLTCMLFVSFAQPVEAASKVSKPTISSVSNTSAGIQVKWKKVKNASGYYVYRKTSGSYKKIATIKSNATISYVDKKASNGTTYTYKLKAYKGKSTSSYSKTKKLKCVKAPTIKSVSNASSGVNISWNKVSKASKYRIYYKKGNSWTKLGDTKSTSYTDKKITNGSTRTYAVRAINGSTFSGYSTAKSYTRITAPTISSVTNVNGGLQIKWNTNSKATQYRVYYKKGNSWVKLVDTKSTSYVDKSVVSGTAKTYSIRAIRNGAYSAYSSSKGTTYVAAPSIATANTTTGIQISWKAVSKASKYAIYYKKNGAWTKLADTTGTSYMDKSLSSGSSRDYMVRTISGKYTSGYSNTKSILRLSTPNVSVSTNIDSNSMDLSWNKVPGATSYAVYRKIGDGKLSKITTVTTNSYTDKVNMGVRYSYAVTALNGNTESDYAETKQYYLTVGEDIAAYYKIVDGKVIDLVSGNEMQSAVVSGEYFSGGTVKLPKSYEKASIETIMVYNRQSTDLPVGNGLSYYGGAFLFQEVTNPENVGQIKTPFGGGQIGTNFILNASLNYNKPVLGDGESYWCLAFDKEVNNYALQVNDDYNEKSHWSNYISASFTLSKEHKFKEFIVYSTRLTKEEMKAHFDKSGVSLLSDKDMTVGRVTDGIADLGSAFAFTKTGTFGVPEWLKTETKAGTYKVDNNNGLDLQYKLIDYVEPDLGIDNSRYESVHIIKKPETLYLDYKYALSAVPYPFNVNHDGKSDQYDVSWSSSDKSVATVIDGLVIPKKTGTVTITATLRGTKMSDSCTIQIMKKDTVTDKVINISDNYVSKNGNRFSSTDYAMTTNAIYDAITEAYQDGYNHIVFPKMKFFASPIETEYYIPTGVTVEFPEGSEFHMMPNEIGKTKGYTFFRMGWDWYDYHIPTEKAYAKKDAAGNVLGYYCKDAHLIIDKYYGEFYKNDASMAELSAGANEYQWGCVLLNIGRKAEYCTVEVREAQCPTGFFIVMGGKVGSQALQNGGKAGSIKGSDFVSGWLNDSGELISNNNWISTKDFFAVEKGANGTDPLNEYFFGDWEHNVIGSTQHLYDVLWFDQDYKLIQADRWQYVDETYEKPAGAAYFKVSMQQSDIPTSSDEYIRLHPAGSSKFCEIRNTKIINGADGLASVVGETEACWIHNNYTSGDGLLNGACWSLDLEDGWQGMRGTIIENNMFRKYAYSSSVGDYRGMDTGIVALASGYNTFLISNYLGSVAQSNANIAHTHIINNVIYTMFSSISGGTSTDIKPKIDAHVYYNVIADQKIKENTSGNGVVYHYGNTTAAAINKW